MGNKSNHIEEFKHIKSLRDEPDEYFTLGKKVRVHRNEMYVKYVQIQRFGWVDDMIECLNHVLEVTGVDYDKGIKLKSPSNVMWRFSRDALEAVDQEPVRCDTQTTDFIKNMPLKSDNSKKNNLKIGERVQLCFEEEKFIKLQNNAGKYCRRTMEGILGDFVTVKHISPSSIDVLWRGSIFSIHPDLILQEVSPQISQDQSINNEFLKFKELQAKLFEAIENGKLVDVVTFITEDLLNAKGYCGRTLINFACCCGQLEILTTLLDCGASMDIHDDNGRYPIHNCVINNHGDIMKFILINDRNELFKLTSDKKTSLMLAVLGNHKGIIKELIEAGINVFLMDDDGKSASDYTTDPEIHRLIKPSSDVPGISTYVLPENVVRCEKPVQSTKVSPNECEICRDQDKNICFIPCGHSSCLECSQQLVVCHICKRVIEKRNKLIL